MGFFKNIWDDAQKFGKHDANSSIGQSTDDLLNSGPNAWKASSDTWKDSGTQTANYTDPSVQSSSSSSGLVIPSDDRKLVKSRTDIVIVVDPGHGKGSENVGASLIKGYEYYVKDPTTGKIKTEIVDTKEKNVTVKNDVNSLPAYVVTDIKSATFNETTGVATKSDWVIKAYYWPYDDGKNVTDKADKEAAELTNKLERVLVWQVAQELVTVLTTIGYSVHTTRESVLDGMTTQARIQLIHSFDPDYSISLHCDGKTDYTVTGAHSEYRNGTGSEFNAQQLEFATDIIDAYGEANAVDVLANSVRRRTDIGVLTPKSTPKLVRKTLLEMGFGSSDTDYNAIYNNRHEIARHLAMGIEVNVNRHFGVLSNEIIGFIAPNGARVLYSIPQQSDQSLPGFGQQQNNGLIYQVDNLPSPPPF